jgi:hypothetical protein
MTDEMERIQKKCSWLNPGTILAFVNETDNCQYLSQVSDQATPKSVNSVTITSIYSTA